jgi:hypothetical protein
MIPKSQNFGLNISTLKQLRTSKKVSKIALVISKITPERKNHSLGQKLIAGKNMDSLKQGKRKHLFLDQHLCLKVLASLMGNLKIVSDPPAQFLMCSP